MIEQFTHLCNNNRRTGYIALVSTLLPFEEQVLLQRYIRDLEEAPRARRDNKSKPGKRGLNVNTLMLIDTVKEMRVQGLAWNRISRQTGLHIDTLRSLREQGLV